MSARGPGLMSRANGAYLVVDHFWRGLELDKEEERRPGHVGVHIAILYEKSFNFKKLLA
jgi:hypothetical protein